MLQKLRAAVAYFTKGELLLWGGSVLLILVSYLAIGQNGGLTLAASLIGVTSLILNAKGNPIGQMLAVAFSLIYGFISFTFHYYGEMITYLGMTAPMAVFALVSWLRNPFKGNRAEVQVNRISRREVLLLIPLAAAVTFVFYWILAWCHTANLLPSTLSVTTSSLAAFPAFRRSICSALSCAASVHVLILLWVMARLSRPGYLSVVICFVIFLVNDIYGFINWSRMQKRQEAALHPAQA